ncbi:hypothetical protein T01_8774 [Trichinella spiralis]|uniref:Uncharacterized protein n=1 Tax=Trichinella spiralis TaxID=6334 RepID=A0A0V1BHX3_TRISP|nr:hypothetical protein T01_8774 [Trichinella spiralis]
MPSGKRETERKGNAPVNTGPSPNSDGRIDNTVKEADEHARGSGPLHLLRVAPARRTNITSEIVRYCKAGKSNAFDNPTCVTITVNQNSIEYRHCLLTNEQ